MFSIILPLFNKEETISKTLESIFSQDFTNFELIIVNDGSTDNSLAIVKGFNDPRVVIITQDNAGVSAARNRGAAMAKFAHLAFIDGDDSWHHNYLSKHKYMIDHFPDAVIYCMGGYNKDNSTGKITMRVAKQYFNRISEVNFFKNPHVFLHTSAIVLKSTVFFKVGGFPLGMRKNEDFALFFSCAFLGKCIYCGVPLSNYHFNVKHQATSLKGDNDLADVVSRFNFVHGNFRRFNPDNKIYLVFLRYEIRHLIKGFLLRNESLSIIHFLRDLSPSVLGVFDDFEINLYKSSSNRYLKIYLINLSKLVWKTRGYPQVTN